MRCQFCGWDNPQGKENCEKCNKPLANAVRDESLSVNLDQDNQSRPTDRYVDNPFNPKETGRGVLVCGNDANDKEAECPKCGYPLENGECSACGFKEEEKIFISTDIEDSRKTIRPTRKIEKEKEVEFKLVPISEETGMPEGDELSYKGNDVVLNRDNTDPNNSTITSQEQALLTYENGKWRVEDKSQYRTTFVQAVRRIELQSGDLLLLGNQLYRFEL